MSLLKVYEFFQDMIRTMMSNPMESDVRFIFSREKERRALCIGIDYLYDGSLRLNGCLNDQTAMVSFLKQHCYFKDEEIVSLRDDTDGSMPNRRRIAYEMTSLVEWANRRPGSSIWFSYAGHGTYRLDQSGDEVDGYDECLVPLDVRMSGVLTDDLLHKLLIEPLSPDVTLFILVDACNSGSVFDIRPYPGKQIYMISGSKDDQVSNERVIDGKVRGNLTWMFENSFNCFGSLSTHYERIMTEIKKMNVSQSPVFTSTASPNGIYLTDSIV